MERHAPAHQNPPPAAGLRRLARRTLRRRSAGDSRRDLPMGQRPEPDAHANGPGHGFVRRRHARAREARGRARDRHRGARRGQVQPPGLRSGVRIGGEPGEGRPDGRAPRDFPPHEHSHRALRG